MQLSEKILNFDFSGTFDSQSCHNFAKGEAYGDPSLNGDVLCLNGEDQFLTVNEQYVDVPHIILLFRVFCLFMAVQSCSIAQCRLSV